MLTRSAISSGITAHRLTKNITLYHNKTVAPVESKPLLLMLPWLGSRQQAVAKYCDFYFRTGFDVLLLESEVKHFLWPRWGLEYGSSILDLLQSDRFVSRPLLVHAFSVGGYTFSQMLVRVSRDTEKYQEVTQRIKGQIYDSLVVGSLDRFAIGLSKTIFPRCEKMVKQAALLYFDTFKHQTVNYFDVAIDAFKNKPITVPALFFYCANDPMSDPQGIEEITDLWRKHGIEVTAKRWENSTHAGHMKRYPQEYLSTLDGFLHSLSISPLKAKI